MRSDFASMVYLIVLLSISNPSFCFSLSPDGLALLTLKSAIAIPPDESFFLNWNESDPDPCSWNGIQCSNSSSTPRVIAISIVGKNLPGYLPSEIGNLQYLRWLNLQGNNLHGWIPEQLFNSTSLRSIFLYDNNISGPMPLSIKQTTRLQHLDLSNNSMSGSIPSDLKICRELQHLVLFHNKFSSEIPPGIFSAMTNLLRLDISSNDFTGFIPADMGELKSLTGTLNLSFNHFSGSIPKTLGDLPATVSFDLRRNNLSGEIPQAGTFAIQGPTAFLDNPYLCGFPLRKSCNISHHNSSKPNPSLDDHNSKSELSSVMILVISLVVGFGSALIGVIMVFIYWKRRDTNTCSCTERGKLGDSRNRNFRSLFCFFKSTENSSEEDSAQGGHEKGELVAIDKGFRFKLEELLGASAYILGKTGSGMVYKVVLANGASVAVRRLGSGGEYRYKEFTAELQAIARVKHQNVVKLRAYYWAPDEKLLITDYISNGNLAFALHGGNTQVRTALSWPTRLRIAKGVARGLAYLHGCGPRKFVHADIKPTNILLDADFNPLISDFGLNRLITITGANPSSAGGYLGSALPRLISSRHDRPTSYWPPEAKSASCRPTKKWDVFSFGVVLFEMLTGKSPEFRPLTSSTSVGGSDLVRWVTDGLERDMPFSDMVDPRLLHEVHAHKQVFAVFQLALACTHVDPDPRPNMKTVSDNLDRIRSG